MRFNVRDKGGSSKEDLTSISSGRGFYVSLGTPRFGWLLLVGPRSGALGVGGNNNTGPGSELCTSLTKARTVE